MRIFGIIAFAKIPEENRTKLEDKSQKYILLGYLENFSCYKLYDPITWDIVVLPDVAEQFLSHNRVKIMQ